MIVFVGQSAGAPTIARLRAQGFGECTLPEEWPPRRAPWFFDNGAFRAWQRGIRKTGKPEPWRARPFLRVLRAIERGESPAPLFIVLPDMVGAGLASLALSMRWRDRCRRAAPVYLAVQDGMTAADIEPLAALLDGLFVGGTLAWKIATGDAWADLAARLGIGCHIGRCGGIARVGWAKRMQARHPKLCLSIDSSLPLFSVDNLDRFVRALRSTQMELIE